MTDGQGGKERACPDVVVLLSAIDDALPASQHARVMAHIATCASCQDFVRGEAAFRAAFAVDRSRQRSPDPNRLFAKFQQRLHEEQQKRIHQRPRPALSRWMPLAVPLVLALALAALIAIAAFLVSQAQAVVLHADVILEHAAREQKAQPANLLQRVRITYTPGATSISTSAPASISPSTAKRQPSEVIFDTNPNAHEPGNQPVIGPIDPSLLLVLRLTQPDDRAQPFNWQSPLDVEHYRAWRASLSQKEETVTIVDPYLVVRTTTSSGPIREAEIVVTREGYHVVRQSYVGAHLGQADIQELHKKIGIAARVAVPVPVIDRAALERVELTARVALRDKELDLGQIQVYQRETPAGIDIDVDGTVPSTSIQQSLTTRLAAYPQVRLDVRVVPSIEAASTRARRAPPAVIEWLAAYGDGAEDRATLVPDITCRASRVAQRLAAIQTLSDRYRPSTVANFAAESQRTFHGLVDAHFTELYKDLTRLDDHLATFIGSAGRPILSKHSPKDWRTRMPDALKEARILAALLTPLGAPARASNTAAPPSAIELREHLDALWRSLNPAPATREIVR